MTLKYRVCALLLALSTAAFAAEVDLAHAKAFAKGWRGRNVRAARTHRTSAGESRFHVVAFEGGGWAAVGADDEDAPVIAFSDKGEDIVEDDRNPIWFLVKRDAEWRAEVRREMKRRGEGRGRARHKGWDYKRKRVKVEGVGQGEGEGLDQVALATTANPSIAEGALEDVRVEPLLKSTWDQGRVGGYLNTPLCYNYCTPSNYVCGCVATMMAQIMRYHEWPKTRVEPKTFPCYVGLTIPADTSKISSNTNCTMKAGVYDWSKMTLKPALWNESETNRLEIGKLCYDVGVSINMMWSEAGSGAYSANAREALVDTFGYSDAHVVVYQSAFHAYKFEELKTIIISNCEAGFPVGYGISGDKVGHAVVIDGYGYSSDETFYIHINPGWSGNSNAWYCPPDLSMGRYSFNTSDTLLYNIFTEGSGALVTGCVVDQFQNPIANAEVSGYTVYMGSNGKSITNEFAAVRTDAKGKFSIKTGVSGHAVTLYATASLGEAKSERSVELASSQTMLGSRTSPFSGSYSTNGYSLGNYYDFDFSLSIHRSVPKVLFR